ncbi:M23 family metallopeptidase [Bacteroidota bacterium]
MAKSKYYFDTEKLTYNLIKVSFLQKAKKILKYSIIVLIPSAILLNVLYFTQFNTIKLKNLQAENIQLVNKYDELKEELEEASEKLALIQYNDDQLYRPVFDLRPLSSSIRIAGYGGNKQYSEFEKYDNGEIMAETSKKVDELVKRIYIQSKSYNEVISKAIEKENLLMARPGIMPISPKNFVRYSDNYGWRIDPFSKRLAKHYGLDFAGPVESEIFATGKGIVTKSGYSIFGYGKFIEIDHGYGYKTRYAHLDKIFVKRGQPVKRGDVIALLGNSGRSTGPHLHYEVRINNKPVNPIYFFSDDDLSIEEFHTMIEFYSSFTEK